LNNKWEGLLVSVVFFTQKRKKVETLNFLHFHRFETAFIFYVQPERRALYLKVEVKK